MAPLCTKSHNQSSNRHRRRHFSGTCNKSLARGTSLVIKTKMVYEKIVKIYAIIQAAKWLTFVHVWLLSPWDVQCCSRCESCVVWRAGLGWGGFCSAFPCWASCRLQMLSYSLNESQVTRLLQDISQSQAWSQESMSYHWCQLHCSRG